MEPSFFLFGGKTSQGATGKQKGGGHPPFLGTADTEIPILQDYSGVPPEIVVAVGSRAAALLSVVMPFHRSFSK